MLESAVYTVVPQSGACPAQPDGQLTLNTAPRSPRSCLPLNVQPIGVAAARVSAVGTCPLVATGRWVVCRVAHPAASSAIVVTPQAATAYARHLAFLTAAPARPIDVRVNRQPQFAIR